MIDTKREFQRVFEFIVKHGPKMKMPNKDIKQFLIWAWEKSHLIVLYDGYFDTKRIAAIAICWQTDHPENKYENLQEYDLNEGDYLSVYGVVVHPEYRHKGCLLMLFVRALGEYPSVKKIFWNHHSRKGNGLKIMDVTTFGEQLLKAHSHSLRRS